MRAIGRSLVGPLGISIAFNAAATAIVLLGDKLKGTADDAKESAEDIQRPFEGLIKIIDAVRGSVDISFDRLRAQNLEVSAAIRTINTEIVEQRRVATEAFEAFTLDPQNRELISNLTLQQFNLTQLEARLKTQQDIREEINESLSKEAEFRQRIVELEEAGFDFTVNKNEESGKGAGNAATELDALEALVEQRDALLFVTSEINREDLRRSAILENEIETLEGVVDVRKRLFIEAARQRQIDERFGAEAERLPARPVQTIEVEFEEGKSPFERTGLQARELSKEVIADVEAQSKVLEDELFADIDKFIVLNERLNDSIQNTLAGGISSFGAALGDVITGAKSFSSLGATVLGTLADLGQSVGQQLVAFGTAGIAIKAFVTNPAAAIVAGLGLIALSRLLRSRVQGQVDAATGGGGASVGFAGSGSTGFDNIGGLLVPRSGDVAQGAFASGFSSRRLALGAAPDREARRVEITLSEESAITLPGGNLKLALQLTNQRDAELGIGDDLGA